MNMIKQIYDSKVETFHPEIEEGQYLVKIDIPFDNTTFYGWSSVHKADKAYESEKVGFHIAHSRAVIKALDYYYKQAKTEFNGMKTLYNNILFQKETIETEMNDLMLNQLNKAEWKMKKLYNEKVKVKNLLGKYLHNLALMVERAEKIRNQKDKND